MVQFNRDKGLKDDEWVHLGEFFDEAGGVELEDSNKGGESYQKKTPFSYAYMPNDTKAYGDLLGRKIFCRAISDINDSNGNITSWRHAMQSIIYHISEALGFWFIRSLVCMRTDNGDTPQPMPQILRKELNEWKTSSRLVYEYRKGIIAKNILAEDYYKSVGDTANARLVLAIAKHEDLNLKIERYHDQEKKLKKKRKTGNCSHRIHRVVPPPSEPSEELIETKNTLTEKWKMEYRLHSDEWEAYINALSFPEVEMVKLTLYFGNLILLKDDLTDSGNEFKIPRKEVNQYSFGIKKKNNSNEENKGKGGDKGKE
ncbi:hypothetical protein OROHE_010408 [Orobanche hederae]